MKNNIFKFYNENENLLKSLTFEEIHKYYQQNINKKHNYHNFNKHNKKTNIFLYYYNNIDTLKNKSFSEVKYNFEIYLKNNKKEYIRKYQKSHKKPIKNKIENLIIINELIKDSDLEEEEPKYYFKKYLDELDYKNKSYFEHLREEYGMKHTF